MPFSQEVHGCKWIFPWWTLLQQLVILHDLYKIALHVHPHQLVAIKTWDILRFSALPGLRLVGVSQDKSDPVIDSDPRTWENAPRVTAAPSQAIKMFMGLEGAAGAPLFAPMPGMDRVHLLQRASRKLVDIDIYFCSSKLRDLLTNYFAVGHSVRVYFLK